LWTENSLCRISIIWNLLWFNVWPNIWSFLKTFLYVFGRMYILLLLGRLACIISVCRIWFIMSFKSSLSYESSVWWFCPVLRMEYYSMQLFLPSLLLIFTSCILMVSYYIRVYNCFILLLYLTFNIMLCYFYLLETFKI
jgi:hypothetical protein